MDFAIYVLSTILQLSSVVMSLIMIRKTGRPFVWIAIALLILLKMVSNIFYFHGFMLIQSNTGSFISSKVLPVPINIFLLLSLVWLASLFRSLDSANKELVQSNQRLDSIISGMNDPLMEIGGDYRIKFVNYKFRDCYGKNGQPLVGRFCYEVTHDKSTPCSDVNHPCPYPEVFKKRKAVLTEHIHKGKDNKDTVVELSCFPLFNTEGNVTSMVEITNDISMRREVEEQLGIFSRAIEQSPSIVVITDLEGSIEYVNPMFTKITGYTKEEVTGQNPRILKSGETPADEYEKLWKTITEGGTWAGEFHNKKKNGELYWESASISGIKDGSGVISHYLAVKKDITMEKEAKIQVEESLKEKEVLLRELYHRTKNNMQVVTGLLKLKSLETDNSEIHQVFEDMENRIHSMSLVHEKLYKSKNLSRINLGEYFADLLAHIKGSYNLGSGRISISSDIEDISVQIDTATPLGLIFNELVSNSMKHAFPETRKGEIRISLKRTDNEKIIMKVTDNGIGFPENYNFRESTSLGIQTILALGEGQLMGNVEMESNGGLTCKVSFKDNIYTARI